ncbi:MAG: BREX system P-loop protein BrxC, partial [Myxococcales bacterium]|nr:BREX system P-loop protein BrxC [Myxococcales bacterium]
YIITGGWPDGHPNQRRIQNGIHEQYVRLLRGIAEELDKKGGPELPTAWISGFYGSGKSSFAKLLGLALDGLQLPDGRSLSQALLDRDTSILRQELVDAWGVLRRKVEPVAVVFDIGGVARDNEHIHAAAVRQVQARLGYCTTEPLVADFELSLERDGEWARFEQVARDTLGVPWDEVRQRSLAEEDFSLVLSVLYPERYPDPMAWFTSRAGTHQRGISPEEAVAAIGDMLRFRRPDATLFLVVDEVSQYVLSQKDRVDRLRAFTSALGARLKGRAWLLALGQQKLDEEADDSFLVWARDRFPPKLRVHLANTNIRDVVHKRLLQKKPDAESSLRALFEAHRADIKLYAYEGDAITPEDFLETYPMLPGHIDLLLRITSALRTRSSRSQGDDQAIRGLLQLLGELFREQHLADRPVGTLVTLDQIYDVQHTALGSDAQESMRRILAHCAGDDDPLLLRAAKAVALLELVQDTLATDARLVAQVLYDRVDRGNQVAAVTEALEELRRRNLLGFSEKEGYKLQSSAGEEW